jgi:magnesium-transporting ATPase (P-type)
MSDHPQSPGAWHALPVEAALRHFASGGDGLAEAEAAARLAAHGPNRLPAPPRRSGLRRFLEQFRNLLVLVLLAAAGVTLALGEWADAGVILGVVLVNALIGHVQEGRAERALEAIGALLAPRATVIRGGRRLAVPAEHLVPGDLVVIEAGDLVPADLRLIGAHELMIEEALLTGEAVPAEKRAEALAPPGAGLGDRPGMAWSGTLVRKGQGRGVVVATGSASEIGRISGLIAAVRPLETPLVLQMGVFARRLTLAILLLAAASFAVGLAVWLKPADEMFLAAVGLAVAAIPEGLPAVMTIALAIGVTRMARRNAIIRRLPAVESLGAVSVICSDKTGTFTRNEMSVEQVVTADAVYEISGLGYAPEGAVSGEAGPLDPAAAPVLQSLALTGLLCNDAALADGPDGLWRAEGDPMEAALLALAGRAGLEIEGAGAAHPRRDELPFDSETRLMAVLTGEGGLHVKGAPESVLARCAFQRGAAGDAPLDAAFWRARTGELAGQGMRVLALAVRSLAGAVPAGGLAGAASSGLTLLGLVGLADPPRSEAVEAVARCRAAGIRVKMITGDHAGTAAAIAARLGLEHPEPVLTGAEIDALDDGALRRRLAATDIFARTEPAHKLRLVQALQEGGEVVAMTGDGVNDAPALRRADIGIAMGRKGAAAAREASEMVLADDNFASIVDAVAEGRAVYANLKKAILYILPTSFGEALAIVLAIGLGLQLPITALQILWINLVTEVTLSLALAFEPAEPGVLARPPRPRGEPLLSGLLLWRILFVSCLFLAGIFGAFAWALSRGEPLEEARSLAVNLVVGLEMAYLFSARRLDAPAWSGKMTLAPVLACAVVGLLQLAFTYAPPLQVLFETTGMSAADWGVVAAAALAMFLLAEGEKALLRRWFSRPARARVP